MNTLNKKWFAYLNCLLILLLSSCSGSDKHQDLKKYIKEVKARPAKPIDSVPDFKPLPPFKYPENLVRRNPFKAVSNKKISKNNAPNINRARQPLENFPLDALKYVGILKQGRRIWGLVVTPNSGEIKRIKIGGYMGQNFGEVKKITSKYIILDEKVKKSGVWDNRMTKLNINSGAGN